MPVCGAGAGGLGTLLRPRLYSNAKYWITTHRPQTGGVVAYPPTRGCGGECRGWHPTPLRLPLASRFVHSKASVLFVYNSESGPAVYAEELEGSLRVPNQSKGMGRQCVRSSKEVGVGIGGVGWGGVGWGGVGWGRGGRGSEVPLGCFSRAHHCVALLGFQVQGVDRTN